MTLGSGAQHSERNGSSAEPMRFLQFWILPDKPSLAPNVELRHLDLRLHVLGQLHQPVEQAPELERDEQTADLLDVPLPHHRVLGREVDVDAGVVLDLTECEADHGYTGVLASDDFSIRASATADGSDAVASLLPVGLRDQSNPYNDVFRTSFDGIVLKRGDIGRVLAAKAKELQAVLDAVKASCWQPDPESSGTCQVG
jgi:hypothetical protein